MKSTTNSRTPLNTRLDLIGWVLVLLILIATPLLVGALRTPPAKGPVGDPSVLIIFLTFLGLIIASSLALWGGMAMGRVKSVTSPLALTQPGGNLVNVLSKFIAGLFIVSGFVKLQDITGFAYKLDDYWDVFHEYTSVFPSSFMKTLSVPIAWFISVFEVALAFALLTAYKMRITSALLMLMLLFFTFLTGFSAITNSVTDCGCFGDALKLTPFQTFGKDIILVFTALPIYLLRKRIQPYYRNPLPALATYGSFLVFGFVSYYAYEHLPFIDFRPAYAPGQDLEYNAVNFNDEGLIIAHDYTPFCADCGQADFEGPVLYIVMYNAEKASEEAINSALELEKQLRVEAPGIKVCGGTNSGKDMRKTLEGKASAGFCLSIQDEKVLKTMVRSSPGFILLNDGIVIKKWHYNDQPTVEELRKMAGSAADQAPPMPEPEPAPVDTSGMEQDSLSGDSIQHPA